MITNLENKLKFIELVDEMKNIERAIFLKNGKKETDAEHSFHLAIMVMIFIEDFPELNYEKCIKLALIHDLVEIFAGDTVVFDKKMEQTKKQREKDAFYKISKEFKETLPDIIDLIEEYENKSSKDSKFVYSLDKVQPLIQIVMEGGKTWYNNKIDFEKIKINKYSKIYPEFGLDKILDIYFEKAEKGNMFYNEE